MESHFKVYGAETRNWHEQVQAALRSRECILQLKPKRSLDVKCLSPKGHFALLRRIMDDTIVSARQKTNLYTKEVALHVVCQRCRQSV